MLDTEAALVEDIAAFSNDPLGFVMYAFDWGHGELKDYPDGPDAWQQETLAEIGQQLQNGASVGQVIQYAIASGHGIGKSALVAWLILWAAATFEDTKGVVTANTENQLKTKTWAELAKWHRNCIIEHWFTWTATSFFSVDLKHKSTWRIDMVAWSENNTEAFAGLHNLGKRILLIYDEASAIPDLIWEVSEGALTDSNTQIIWFCAGNPTKNTGRFRECFGKFRHRWVHKQIDSRSVKISNKAQIAKWVEDYGDDSDFVRVRVKGQFPRIGENALISAEDIDAAMARAVPFGSQDHAATVLGVDVARQGADSSAIARRQGRVMFIPRMMKIPSTTLVAGQVVMDIQAHDADAVFVDESGGYGAGVIDEIRRLNFDCMGVQFGGKAIDALYFDKRSEMYFLFIEWIKTGGCLPNSPTLKEELLALTYTFCKDKFRLCSKDDIKAVIGRSPDEADACALTFAFPVSPKLPFNTPSSGNRKGTYSPYLKP